MIPLGGGETFIEGFVFGWGMSGGRSLRKKICKGRHPACREAQPGDKNPSPIALEMLALDDTLRSTRLWGLVRVCKPGICKSLQCMEPPRS